MLLFSLPAREIVCVGECVFLFEQKTHERMRIYKANIISERRERERGTKGEKEV